MTNRTSSEQILAGGKGINVSIVLKNIGLDNTALGFVAGFTGDEISERLKCAGINTDFIKVAKGLSRINLKLKSIDGTEINAEDQILHRRMSRSLRKSLKHLRQVMF